MKTVFTNSEITHVWASQKQATGRACSMKFDGPTFYSYAEPIAQFQTMPDGSTVVLLNRRSFSVTTRSHQSAVAFAVSNQRTIDVGYINAWGHVALDGSNQDWYASEIKEAIGKAARAKTQWNQDYCLRRANELANDMRTYCELFGLAWEVPTVPTDLAAARVQVKVKSKAKAEAKRKRDAEMREKYASDRAAWLAGERIGVWFADTFGTDLRIVNDEIETSRGARFPIAHAKRGLALIDAVVSRVEEWKRNGQTCRLGFYQIDRIEANGTVHAGCHVVSLAAINRIRAEIVAYVPSPAESVA